MNINFHTPFPIINAVVEGQQDGKIYNLPDCTLIMHKCGFAYCKPLAEVVDYSKLVEFLLRQNELPQYFHVYDAPSQLCAAFKAQGTKFNIKVRSRLQLKFPLVKQPIAGFPLPAGYTSMQITINNINALATLNLKIEDKFWRSGEDFIKHGFGYAVFASSGEAASVCYTASIVDNIAEIDVATLPAYQQKGLAKVAVGEFLKHCIINQITASWDCFEDNIGSLRIAEGLGFEQTKKYTFLSIYN